MSAGRVLLVWHGARLRADVDQASAGPAPAPAPAPAPELVQPPPAPTLNRILVFGGRDYNSLSTVFAALDRADQVKRIDVIVHGSCGLCCCGRQGCLFQTLRGADGLAEQWAVLRGRGVERHPANWHPIREIPPKHMPMPPVVTEGEDTTPIDKSAGPRRNLRMAQSLPAGAVAFPGGRGTANMAALCEQHGIRVWHPTRAVRRAA